MRNCFPLSSEEMQLALGNRGSPIPDVSTTGWGSAAHALAPAGPLPCGGTHARWQAQRPGTSCSRDAREPGVAAQECAAAVASRQRLRFPAGAVVNAGESCEGSSGSCWALLARAGLQQCRSLSWGWRWWPRSWEVSSAPGAGTPCRPARGGGGQTALSGRANKRVTRPLQSAALFCPFLPAGMGLSPRFLTSLRN